MKYVVALNYVQFKTWCSDNYQHPASPNITCITTGDSYGTEKLRGRFINSDDEVIYYGTWKDGNYAKEVEEYIHCITIKAEGSNE